MNVPFQNEVRFESLDGSRAPSEVIHLDAVMLSVWTSIVRHRILVATITSIGVFCSVLYLVITPAQYSSSVLIVLDPRSNSTLREMAVSDANVDSAKIESEVEILKSDRILRQVVQSEKLAGSASLSSGMIRSFISGVFRLMPFNSDESSRNLDTETTAASIALGKLTSVKRLGLTYVVEVTATMLQPQLAAEVANAYAKTYIDNQLAAHEELARQMGNLLRRRTDDLQSQAQTADLAVEQLKFSGSLDGENSASARVSLNNLESRAQTLRTIHDKMLEQFTTTSQQQFSDLADARIGSAAYAPLSKSSPKSLLVLVSGLFIGVLSGTLTAMLLDRRRLHA